MFPTIFALGLEGMGVYTKKASSYIVMGVAGGAFSPMLMGYIGEENMALGSIVPLIAFLYLVSLSNILINLECCFTYGIRIIRLPHGLCVKGLMGFLRVNVALCICLLCPSFSFLNQ